MKIAFIVPGFSADETDWCIPAQTEVVRALARKHTVHVFAMRYPHRVDTFSIGGARVHSFNGVGSRGAASAQLWRRVLTHVARENRAHRFDVIHAIFGGEAGWTAVLAGQFLRVPSIVWMVDGELVGLREIGYGADLAARQRLMNAFVLRHAARVLCGCTPMLVRARARYPRARVEHLPLGVNVERFYARARNHADAHFVNVGSLVLVKGQTPLLRAFKLLVGEMPRARLTITGVGPLENELRALARDLNLAARVTFAGNVPHEGLADLYHTADVFVQASLHEGQGMALLEAAACGCAVCGTNVGALADFAVARAASASPVGDANALADAMRAAYTARVELAARGTEKIEREYNLARITERLETLYARLNAGDEFSFAHHAARA
jgi:glycogen(starch) synthase